MELLAIIIFVLMCRSITQNEDGSVKKNKFLSQKMQRLRQKSRDKVRKFKARFRPKYKPPEEESRVMETPPGIE